MKCYYVGALGLWILAGGPLFAQIYTPLGGSERRADVWAIPRGFSNSGFDAGEQSSAVGAAAPTCPGTATGAAAGGNIQSTGLPGRCPAARPGRPGCARLCSTATSVSGDTRRCGTLSYLVSRRGAGLVGQGCASARAHRRRHRRQRQFAKCDRWFQHRLWCVFRRPNCDWRLV